MGKNLLEKVTKNPEDIDNVHEAVEYMIGFDLLFGFEGMLREKYQKAKNTIKGVCNVFRRYK